jgi:hypothetical protein
VKVRIIAIFAFLWRFISRMWSILILGIIIGVLGNIAFTYLTTGKMNFTEPRVVAWLNKNLYWFVTILIVILLITLCSYLAYRKQQKVAREHLRMHEKSFVDIAEGVRKVLEGLNTSTVVSPASTSGGTPIHQEIAPPNHIWNVPFRRNPFFTGREDILQRLHNTLHQEKAAALTQPQAISGLGGIGKTRTAIEYAYRHQDDYQAVLWAKAESRETLVSDFVTIAHLLSLSVKEEQDLIVRSVKRWLQDHTGWLLIFDNADDLTMVRDFLPSGGKGHILLTTRAQATGRIAQRIQVERMEPDEGTLFLLHRAMILDPNAPLAAASISDQDTAREIALLMDGLPLALDQAAAYIEETRCSLSDYLHLFQTRQEELLKRRGGLVTNHDHPDPVATTWSLSFKRVQQANPAAADLLQLCAFLDADMIQEEIIIKGASELGPVLQSVAADPIKLDEAIGALLAYSLVRRTPNHTLTMHRLVQAVLKYGLQKDAQRLWAERTVRAVSQAFPEVERENWLQCQQYIPHVLMCAKYIDQWEMAFPEAALLLNNAGVYLTESAQYEQAEPFLQQALSIREQVLGPDHPDTLGVRANYNDLLQKTKDQQES